MRVNEVAKALGVKRSAVRKAIKRGVLPASQSFDTGTGEYEYDVQPDAVEAYRREHRRVATPAVEEGDES